MTDERVRTRAFFHYENRTGDRWWDPVSNWTQAEREERDHTFPSASSNQPTITREEVTLRPNPNVHKYLISTPARFVGELELEDLLLTHAWQDFFSPVPRQLHVDRGPTYLIAAVKTAPPKDEPEVRLKMFPNYYAVGDFLAVCMSVYFGKWFHHHGFVETNGHFCLPSPAGTDDAAHEPMPPYTSTPRIDFPTELNVGHLAEWRALLAADETPAAETQAFLAAGRFYVRALATWMRIPDAAFLDLITAGEILSNQFAFTDEQVFDAQTLNALVEIRDKVNDATARMVRQRLFQVKKRFVMAVSSLLDDDFFAHTECKLPSGGLTKPEIVRVLGAAYDLRSKYVHTGLSLGVLVRTLEPQGLERQIGQIVIEDKEVGKIIDRSPTLLGLERIIRYALRRFVTDRLLPGAAQLPAAADQAGSPPGG